MPETARLDVGASMVSTGRSLRLIEIIEDAIKEGRKMTPEDMVEFQSDLTDVIARAMTPHITSIARKAAADESFGFSEAETKIIGELSSILEEFDAKMTTDSIGATVYSFWQFYFYGSMLHVLN